MGKAKKTRKFAEVKRMLNPKDDRIKALRGEQQKKKVRGRIFERAAGRVARVCAFCQGLRFRTTVPRDSTERACIVLIVGVCR